MALKIKELESIIGPGARSNKYRVLFPSFGRELDIQTHNITVPGASIGVSEVFLKGRKYQLAGDRSDEGTCSMTIYNDPGLNLRTFLMKTIDSIQSYSLGRTFGGQIALFGGALPYQGDIVIEQLDHNQDPISKTVLHDAFITEVGSIEYQDEIGEVLTTDVTIVFTSLSII